MESVFGVTTTDTIVDSDTCKLSNGGTVMSITPSPEDDDIPNCTYIINLPPTTLSHNGGGDHFETGGGNGGDGSELTVEIMKHVPDAVTFTELTDLDNGIVTKVEGNNEANAISVQEGGEQGSESGGGNEDVSISEIIPPKVIHHPTAIDLHDIKVVEGEQGGFSIGLNGAGEICASSNLLKLIHQGHPEAQVEGLEGTVQGVGQTDHNVNIEGESPPKAPVAIVGGKGIQKKKEEIAEKGLDHCNNESIPKMVKSPMRTYSRKNKGLAQQPPAPEVEPSSTSTMSSENSTSPIESKIILSPPVDVKVFLQPPSSSSRHPLPAIRVMESKRVSIPIPQERKRKLVIDSHKQINNTEFKKQLIQTGDILHERQADLGPSTRQALKCLEFGGVAQFFVSPGRSIGSSPLSKLYYNQLVMDVEPNSRKQKGSSKSPKLVPLNSNDLKILSSTDNDGSNESTEPPKQRIHVGQLNATSLEAEFKSYKFTKPFVFKEYASVRWKSTSSPNTSSGQTYSKLKRSLELRRKGQGENNAQATLTNATDRIGSIQTGQEEDAHSLSIDETPSQMETAQTDDGSDIKEEEEMIPGVTRGENETLTGDMTDVDYIDIQPEVKIKDEEFYPEEFILPGGPNPTSTSELTNPQPSNVPIVEPVDETSQPPDPVDPLEIKKETTTI